MKYLASSMMMTAFFVRAGTCQHYQKVPPSHWEQMNNEDIETKCLLRSIFLKTQRSVIGDAKCHLLASYTIVDHIECQCL